MEESLREANELIKSSLKVKLAIQNSADQLRTKRGLQSFLSIKPSNNDVRRIYEVLIGNAVKAEALCPGAGLIFLQSWVNSDGDMSCDMSKPKTRRDVEDLLKVQGLESEVVQLLMCALDHATVSSNITIKKSAVDRKYVEVTDGYTFTAHQLFKYDSVDLKDCKVLAIDGYIESVSEIHHMLESLSERKSPCVLFARGMSDDVVHTLKVNYDRKTVLVYPHTVPFDVENANFLVDVATVAGGDVVSSLKGDLISSVKLETLASVDRLSLSSGTIRISNEKTKKRVREHCIHLKKTIEDRPEIEEILSKRLRSLSSSCIDICIPEGLSYFSVSSQLDFGIRLVSSIMNNTYDAETVVKSLLDSTRESLSNSMIVHLL